MSKTDAAESQLRAAINHVLADVFSGVTGKDASMSVTKKESDGSSHPASHYLVVEDPQVTSTWHLRVKDASGKVDHGLMGGAWAALHGGYRGSTYQGPQKAAALTKLKALYASEKMDTPGGSKAEMNATLQVAFSVDDCHEDGDDVVLSGRFFKPGVYPDKGFSLTPQEMHDSIDAFLNPVPMDLEHLPAIFGDVDLRGAFGQIEQVWANDDDTWLMARARKPKWLHNVMPETRVSATFNRSTKAVTGAAWTGEPRVNGAELVAQFASYRKHSTPTGQAAIQAIHNHTVLHGAVCKRPDKIDKPVTMASRHEAAAIQQTHDTTVEHGAICETQDGSVPSHFSATDKSQRSNRTMKIQDWLLGKAKEDGVDLDPSELETFNQAAPASNVTVNPKAAFSQTDDGDTTPDKSVADLTAKIAQRDGEIAELRKAQEAHTAQFAQVASERRQAEAVAFSERQVTSKKLTPASADKLTPLMARIAATDSTATFAEGDKPTSVLLQEFLDSLVDLSMFTTETIKPEQVAALFQRETTPGTPGNSTDGMTNERKAELLSKTQLGRATIKGLDPKSTAKE